MSTLEELSFSNNWNNKLNCNYFSTIRLHNPNKYYVGCKMKVTLKGRLKPNPAIIKTVTIFKIDQLTEGMALLDTGCSKAETIKIIEKMYKNKVTNLSQQLLDFVILGFVKSETITNQLPLL